jgi:probable HAF family extracellular repeat protein
MRLHRTGPFRAASIASLFLTTMASAQTAGPPDAGPPPVRYERIDLGTLGGMYSQGLRIDDRGRVLGWSTNASGEGRFFLWESGGLVDPGIDRVNSLNEPDMNRKGAIVGRGTSDGTGRAFLFKDGALRFLDFGRVVAINDRGAILGYDIGSMVRHEPLVWEKGARGDLPPSGSYSCPGALNNRGEVVGEVGLPSGEVQTIRRRPDGSYETAMLDGTSICTAGAINDRGQAIGWCEGPTRVPGFLWHDGVMMDLEVGAGIGHSVEPIAINERGQVAGFICSNGLEVGFHWQNGAWTELGLPPGLVVPPGYAAAASPPGLNDHGQVVGRIVVPAGGPPRAFVWERGAMTNLGPGIANDINRHGMIVGTSDRHAVVWRPLRPTARFSQP